MKYKLRSSAVIQGCRCDNGITLQVCYNIAVSRWSFGEERLYDGEKEQLHALYPNAYMVWTHTNSNAGKYAVSAMNDRGILKQGYMKVAIIPKVGADGTVGANNHNSMATHIATAEILASVLETTWGFTRIRQNITLEDYLSVLKRF